MWWLGGLVAAASALLGATLHIRRSRRRSEEALRRAASRDRGWVYQADSLGFLVAGRHLTRAWELLVERHAAGGHSLFTLGAPDPERAWALLVSRSGNGTALSDAPDHPIGVPEFVRRFALHAGSIEDAGRVLDEQMQRHLVTLDALGAEAGGRRPVLKAWVCPHGIVISLARGLDSWREIEEMVGAGLALARRAGLV
ncbi:MAG: hypothetical protein JSW68_00135 [Burkholderiales bacterium]|nr:MAG: hypothetical protein JSW68_00135 [Burkholderiales bacterium]